MDAERYLNPIMTRVDAGEIVSANSKELESTE